MHINSHTHLYGVLGDPVDHSLSPLIHNAAFRELQMNAVYLAFHVQPEALGLAFEGIRSLEIRGANLTIPFKEIAIEFVDEIPEDVDRATGAVNTVVNKKGQLHGYNTDGPGFLRALREELSFNPEGKNILLLGAGGAARSVLFALSRAHADRVFIHNRSRERAEGLAEVGAPHFPETEVEPVISLDELRLQKIDLVVNATSCGMTPPPVSHDRVAISPPLADEIGGGVKGNTDIPFDLKQLKKQAVVYDLVYSPLETPFLKSARSLGWPAANGLRMLAEQAALSFELWTGKKEGVREAMLGALQTCHL